MSEAIRICAECESIVEYRIDETKDDAGWFCPGCEKFIEETDTYLVTYYARGEKRGR